MVGICLYAALIHLQIGLRPPIDHTHSLFGLVALCTAFTAVASIERAAAHTPDEFLRAAHHTAIAVPLLLSTLPWFIHVYSMQTRRWLPMLLSMVSLGALVGNFWAPYSIVLSGPPILSTTTMPWGENIAQAVNVSTLFQQTIWCANFLTVVQILFAGWRLYRRGPMARALSFTVAMIPLIVALGANLLIALHLLNFINIGALGCVAMIALMSTSLGGEWRRVSKKLQVMLDHVPAVVYLKRLDGRYMFVNRQFETLYRLPARRSIGATDKQLFSGPRSSQHDNAEQAALRETQPVESEETILFNDDVDEKSNPRCYSWLHFPLINGRGLPYAICGISTDITERKAVADTLRTLAASLDRRVIRRTEQLANVNRELEAFAYSVSHDLRAPLTAVNGFAELLLREYAPKLDQTAQRYLTRIREGSTRMTSLIQDLLNLSRVTSQVVERQTVDLVSLANETLKTQRDLNPTRQVTLKAPDTLQVNADMRLLGIAMTNLVENAWKYTSKVANAQIEIGMTEHDGEKIYFVKDNGAGFDAKYAERLFRPFVRLHSEKEFPGTGIGLATVARIINRHGGRIWAEASFQQGATFFFTLPNVEEELEEKATRQEAAA